MQPVTRARGFGLSIQQTHLCSLQRESTAYRTFCQIQIEASLNLEKFHRALHTVVDRHAILRTHLRRIAGMDVPIQVISSEEVASYLLVSLEGIELIQQKSQVEKYAKMLHERPFTSEADPVLSCTLLRLSQTNCMLLMSLPAFCADAATLQLFVDELMRVYHVYVEGMELPYEEPLQYVDVAVWQDELLQDEEAEEQKAFWRKSDLSLLASLSLPFGRQAFHTPDIPPSPFASQMVVIANEGNSLPLFRALVQKTSTSFEAFWLACWLTSIWRLTDQKALLLGVECNGRYHKELTDVLGLLSQVVPLNVTLTNTLSFERLLVRVYAALQEAKRRQIYFSWNVASATSAQKFSSNSFPISFAYEEWPSAWRGADVTFRLVHSSSCIEPFALKLHVLQVGQEVRLHLYYNPDLLSSIHVERIAKSFHVLLNDTCIHPDRQIDALPILSLQDQQELRQRFITPALPAPFRTIVDVFESQVTYHPDRVTIVCEDEQVTYAYFNSRASCLAQALRGAGVSSNVPVGLYGERSIDMLVGMLAILKAGGGYVPLDPDQPVARLVQQVQDLQTPVILTQTHLLDRLSFWDGLALCLDDPQTWKEGRLALDPLPQSSAEDLAYIIYTSGSTGTPKGVMVRHGSVVNYAFALCEVLALQAGLRFATVSTLSADLGNTAIFCSFASGGCLHILKYEMVTSGYVFANYMAQNSIDVLKIVPSHLSALLASCNNRMTFPREYLILGGEALSFSLLRQLYEMGCSSCVVNHYGPTEATIGALINVIGRPEIGLQSAHQHAALTVPIGRPIAGMEAYILDQYQQVLPVGVMGELYLGGVGLAAGYLNQPEQTQQRFVPHPWSKERNTRLYRTGDLARYNDDGSITFVGRTDSQVKLRGYRIEPGEVEAILQKYSEVRECAVVLREDTPGDKRLVAYIVAQHHFSDEEALRCFMQERLPEYMVPSFFVFLRVLPFNTNGKIDRQMLPPPRPDEERRRQYVAPRTPVEEILVEIWKSVLQVKQISIYDTFVQLGGHSLLATLIISRIRQSLQIDLPLRYLFETPTVAGLAERIEQLSRSRQRSGVPPITPALRNQPLPLSFAQQRLWFLNQLEPDSPAYNVSLAIKLEGGLNVRSLARSLEEIVKRHESLRTIFPVENGTPCQVIRPASPYLMPIVDLRGVAADRCDAQVRYLARQDAQRIFDLAHGPLLHTMLLWATPNEYVLLHTTHHIISDAWSRNVFTNELIALYNAFNAGKTPRLPSLLIQYADFACWQKQWLQGEILQAQLDYWTRQLHDVPALEFPTDRPYPPVQTFRGAQIRSLLSSGLSEAVKQLGQREGATLFMTLLAAFQVLLAYYTGQTDIAVGSPIANRSQAEIEQLIGFFTNTLVIRSNLSGNLTFREVLAQVRETALDAYAHQDLPFEKLVEVLQPERNMGRSPLFQVLFQLQHISSFTAVERLQDVTARPLELSGETAKFDFTLSIVDSGQELANTIEFNTDLFNGSTITLLLERWRRLLEIMVDNPDQRLADLSLLTDFERQQVLVAWNSTEDVGFSPICVHLLFEKQVERTPDAVATVYLDEHLTYQTLNQQANRLAYYLRTLGVGQEIMVGICTERSLLMAISVVGTLKAGGVYVPLDPEYPSERIAFMLNDAHVSVLLTQQQFVATFPEYTGNVVLLDDHWERIVHECTENPGVPADSDQLLYVIYTSGSTGRPKGIGLSHRALTNLLFWHFANLAPAVRTLQFASLGFDASFLEMFAAWCSGGTLYVLSTALRRDVVGLAQFLSMMAIEKVILPVVVLQQLTEYYCTQSRTYTHLRELIATGEQLQITASVSAYFQRENYCVLHNYYGPSESHVVTSYTLGNVPATWPARPPIGRPIANTQIYLLNQSYEPVPVGVAGELYIGGVSLARGYLNRPEQTAERFIPHPFDNTPGGRLYKTGDRARYLADGTIEYLGRLDLQVKIRGHRVELAEIESMINQCAGVREAVVGVRDTLTGDRRLVAYVVLDKDTFAVGSQDVRRYLRQQLPEYMIPSTFLYLDSLPLTINGKIDHRALQSLPEQASSEQEDSFVAPRTSAEEVLAIVWQDVLGKQVGVYDNFFDIGGHSLLATQIVARVGVAFQIELPIRSLFEAPTIDGLISEIAAIRGGRDVVEEIAQILQEIGALTEDEVR